MTLAFVILGGWTGAACLLSPLVGRVLRRAVRDPAAAVEPAHYEFADNLPIPARR